MPRLLENVAVAELESLLKAGQPGAAMAHLTDPAAVRRAKRWARVNGIYKTLDRDFDPAKPILAIKRSDYRGYQRTGTRASDNILRQRQMDITQAGLALWLDHAKASVDYLQDLMWAACDDYTWVLAPHENSVVDLFSSLMAARLCDVLACVGDRLEPEVVTRVRGQIEARVLLLRDHPSNWWRTCHNNWNHVCNGNIIETALYLWQDTPERLATLVHRCVVDMQAAVDGFADDGGCLEGPGYWAFGFGHFASAAYALHAATAGRINLMSGDPKLERIARYPLAAHIEGERHAPFADTSHGYVPVAVALKINRLLQAPELYALCRLHANRTLVLGACDELGLYQGEQAPKVPPADSLLPDLGLARLRSAPGKHQLTVVATAGNNGVSHNHNDVGSFVAYRDGVEFLTDPGAPIYTSKTFSSRRYEILLCNSLGHSVPVVNGQQQGTGKEYFGTLATAGLDSRADKSLQMELAQAYPASAVESLLRTLQVDYAHHTLTITDAYRFQKTPRALLETFITYEPVRVTRDGQSVRIGQGKITATLTAHQPGRFKPVAEVEASKEGRTGKLVTRIIFTPRKLQPQMTLTFKLI